MAKRNAETRRHRGAGIIILLALLLICAPVFAQDGEISEWLTYENHGNIYVFDTLTGETRILVEGWGNTWSPDGSRLLYFVGQYGKAQVKILDVENDTDRYLMQMNNALQNFPVWLTTEKILLTIVEDDGETCHWYVVDANTGELHRPPNQDDEICNYGPFDFTDDRQYLMLRDIDRFDDDRYYLLDIQAEKFTRYLNRRDAEISPVTNQIAFASRRDDDVEIYVMDIADGQIRQLTDQPEFASYSPSWSTNGQQIAFMATLRNQDDESLTDEDQNQIHVVNVDGTNMRHFNTGYGIAFFCDWANCISWTDDDSQIIFWTIMGTHTAMSGLDPVTGQVLQALDSAGWSPSPCRQYFAFQGDDFNLYVRDFEGNNIRQVSEDEPGLFSTHWRPQPECMKNS